MLKVNHIQKLDLSASGNATSRPCHCKLLIALILRPAIDDIRNTLHVSAKREKERTKKTLVPTTADTKIMAQIDIIIKRRFLPNLQTINNQRDTNEKKCCVSFRQITRKTQIDTSH